MGEILASLIWTCVLGLAVGNYATSFVYRMPKQESPFTKHPYCGGCGTMLQVKDLFPAVSWLMLKGRCRYCAMEIPSVYFWTEIFCAIIFMIGVLSMGFSESYILVIIAGTCVVTLWGLEFRVQKIFNSLLVLIAAIGFSYRILQDGTIYPSMYGIFWGAALPMFWWRFRQDKNNLNGEKERFVIPQTVALGATAGAWFATFGLFVFVILWAAFSVIYKAAAKHVLSWPENLKTAPYAFALMLLMLFPNVIPQVYASMVELLHTLVR